MLTPEDVKFIQLLIDERIQAFKGSQPNAQKQKDYHTTHDIREIIIEHLDELKRFVGDEPFSIAVIRSLAKNHATYRARDLDPILGGKTKAATTRFESQINNAVQAWPDGPFRRVHTGLYALKDS